MKAFKPYYLLAGLLLSSLGLTAQDDRAKIKVEAIEGPVPWSSLDVQNDPNHFQFVIVTDRTGGHRPGVFLDGVRKLNLLRPELVMSVGDLIEGYTEDTVELNRQWKEFTGFIDEMEAPFFYVPGNHDITNAVMEEKWRSLFGPTYYHFVYKDVLFLCLNSEDNLRGAGRGTIDDQQYDYIKKTLEDNPDVRWTLVFMHQPLWMQEDTKRWADVEKLLNDRKHSVFVGHIHRYIKFDRNNGKYFTLATTGGGSQLRGKDLGEFDHVVWVTMTEQGPVMANLMLEGIWDENVTTEEQINFARPLADAMPIQMEPILLKDQKFEQASSQVKIINDSDVLMHVKLQSEAHLQLLPDVVKKEIEIQPNSVEMFDLNLKALQVLASDDLEPLTFHAQISYQEENQPRLEIGKPIAIKPEQIQKLLPAESKIKLDGQLKEWKSLAFSTDENSIQAEDPFSHQGNQDASFQFDVRYDQDYLYAAIQVKDDEVLTDTSKWIYRQDHLAFVLDAQPQQISANSRGGWDNRILIIQSPNAEMNEQVYRPDRVPEGVKSITRRNAQGYQTEIAIPLKYLQEMQGQEDWKSLRINVSIRDYDQDYQHNTALEWRPEWSSDRNYVGSGIFFKDTEF